MSGPSDIKWTDAWTNDPQTILDLGFDPECGYWWRPNRCERGHVGGVLIQVSPESANDPEVLMIGLQAASEAMHPCLHCDTVYLSSGKTGNKIPWDEADPYGYDNALDALIEMDARTL